MKLILEIEPGDDVQGLEPILKLLKPYLSRIQPSKKLPATDFMAIGRICSLPGNSKKPKPLVWLKNKGYGLLR